MRNRLFAFGLFASLAAACGGSQTTAEPAPAPVVEEEVVEEASLLFVDAATTAAVNISSGELVLAEGLETGQWTTERSTVPAGDHTLTFAAASGDTLATSDVALEVDGAYTVVFAGLGDSRIRAQMPQAIVVTDDLAAPGDGEARLRFVHAVPGDTSLSFGDGSGRGYAAGMQYTGVSAWYDLVPGNDTVEISAGGEAVATIAVPLAAGRLFTVVVAPDGDGVRGIVINEVAP